MADIRRTSEYRKLLPFIARASGDVGSDTVGEDVSALLLALETHKTSGDHDGRYYTETEIDSALALKADKTITLTAGNGLTGGGNLSENRTFNVVAGDGITVYADSVDVLPGLGIDFDSNGAVIVDLTVNYAWTGNHSFTKTMYAGSIMPHNSDTYDLGSSAHLWRKIWGSELSAVVFAQYEQVLLGGWFTVSKGEGVLEGNVLDGDSWVDLGVVGYSTGDVIVFRGVSGGSPIVEYMQINNEISPGAYSVTRNIDGSGANQWLKGAVYANYGQIGDGRIELNAYDSPRMSVFSHSDTIANFREQVRIGDLINGWGYSASTYGAAFGAYEPGQANITIDPTNGIRIRNYDQNVIQLNGTDGIFTGTVYASDGSFTGTVNANSGYLNDLSVDGTLTLNTNGKLLQGTGTWQSSFTGSAIWNESGVMNVGGWNNGVKQWWGGSDGAFYTASGNIKFSDNGIIVKYTVDDTARLVFENQSGIAKAGIFYNIDDNMFVHNWVVGGAVGFSIQQTNGEYPSAYWHEKTTNQPCLDIWGALWVTDDFYLGGDGQIKGNLKIDGSGEVVGSLKVGLNAPNPGTRSLTVQNNLTVGYFTALGSLQVGAANNDPGATNALIGGNLRVNGTITGAGGVAYLKGGTWKSWTPSQVGWTALPTGVYRYCLIGKICFFIIDITAGTSNAAAAALTLPYTVKSGAYYGGVNGMCMNNGTVLTQATKWYIDTPVSQIRFGSDMSTGLFTASGTKRMRCEGFYEIA